MDTNLVPILGGGDQLEQQLKVNLDQQLFRYLILVCDH